MAKEPGPPQPATQTELQNTEGSGAAGLRPGAANLFCVLEAGRQRNHLATT